MNILLKKDPKGEYKETEVTSMLLEDIAAEQKDEYDFLLARVNGIDTELTGQIQEGDRVELLDMRTHAADLVYQRSLTLIYITAARDVFEAQGLHGIRVKIENSLNKGFFTRIIPGANADEETRKALSNAIEQEYIDAIEARMRQIVEENLPIEKEVVSKKEGVARWKEYGYPEKAELLAKCEVDDYKATFYRIGNYINYFFGPMVPSTGYIKLFELHKYRRGILLRFPHYSNPNKIPEYVDDNKIYGAFAEEHEWLGLLDAQNVADLNRTIENGGGKDMILLSEALHEKKIAEIADMIKTGSKRIILIAGPSSSGKTTFAKRLCIQLRVLGLVPLYMGTDDYFVERVDTPVDENGEKNYENLNALDIDLFSSNMNDLLAGKEVDIPEFDFIDGKKHFGRRLTRIKKNQPIVIEGIHALNGKLTEQIDDKEKFKIYISPLTQINIDTQNRVPTTDARMLRRMVRDYKCRGHSAAGTIRDWPKVREGENKNIFPYNGEADVLFNSTLAYETSILKKYAVALLEEIKPEEPEYSEAVRLMEFLRFFREIEEEKDIPNNSIIREFIGGSVFAE
ncbi:MAG: nucleoside kinase [Clostridia bacterium]|nr:nucleoside kinase [Clostridia bacterium]